MSSTSAVTVAPATSVAPAADRWYPLRRMAEALLAPLLALIAAGALFSVFLLFLGQSPLACSFLLLFT